MEEPISQEGDLGEYYRTLMRSYYERLQAKHGDAASRALEEVKLRLFLALLDRPDGGEYPSGVGPIGVSA